MKSMSLSNVAIAADQELGPVLLERKVRHPDEIAFLCVGLVCLVTGAGLTASGLTAGRTGFLLFGGFMAVLGVVISLLGFQRYWPKRGGRIYVHKNGVRSESKREAVRIGYDEADEIEYRVTDHYHNGAYVGTTDHFALRTSGGSVREIVYRGPRRKREDQTPFPAIVDRISARLARRIAAAVGNGESVRWGTKMTIHADGLTLGSRPAPGKSGQVKRSKQEAVRVGWDEIEKVDVDEGSCRVQLKGNAKPRLTMDVSETNFSPGYRFVADTITARAASQPVEPVRGLAHGERITVEYPYSLEVRFGIERAAFLVSPKAQKSARERRLALAVIVPALGAGLATMAFFEGKLSRAALQLRLLLCFLAGVAMYCAIEVWERVSRRMRVHREARLAQSRFEAKQGPDPDYLYRVTVGPPGFSCRMPGGEFERSWSAVSRVLWDRGSIIICQAGNAVQEEIIAVFIPALAFEDLDRARDAFERIIEWHQASRKLATAS
jgi:hypothetical protein